MEFKVCEWRIVSVKRKKSSHLKEHFVKELLLVEQNVLGSAAKAEMLRSYEAYSPT